jgi:molecular chaperone GrpE
MPDENGGPDQPLVDDSGEEIEIEFVDVDDDPAGASTRRPSAPATQEESGVGDGSLRNEVERLREMYLRKLAEFDNFRKRTDRERKELRRTAAEGLVTELLPVLDNFERAMQHADESEPQAFREGVEMIAGQFADLLARNGLEGIDPMGSPFDPELHEAVQRVEGSDQPPGTVVSIFSKGYTFGGKLIRPAMVGVAVDPVSPMGSPPPTGEEGEDEGGVT